MSTTLANKASEVAEELEARYRGLLGAAARRSSRSLLYLTAFGFAAAGGLITYSYHSESAQKLWIGLTMMAAGVGIAALTRGYFSSDPIYPPERLLDIARLLRTAEELSGLSPPVSLEVDLTRADKIQGTYRDAFWKASLEWEFLGSVQHDRTEFHQNLTEREQREGLTGESQVGILDRSWSERGVRATVHMKRLLLRVELDGRLTSKTGRPTEHLSLLRSSQGDSTTTFLLEFPKNHSEKEGLGFQDRPNLGIARVNRHHPEFVGQQVGRALVWLLAS